MSLVWPPVSTNSSGFPNASVIAWTLVLKPPRERPKASSLLLLPAAPAAQGCARFTVESIKTVCNQSAEYTPHAKLPRHPGDTSEKVA